MKKISCDLFKVLLNFTTPLGLPPALPTSFRFQWGKDRTYFICKTSLSAINLSLVDSILFNSLIKLVLKYSLHLSTMTDCSEQGCNTVENGV